MELCQKLSWSLEEVNDLVSIITSNEAYRKKLITEVNYTGTTQTYESVLKEFLIKHPHSPHQCLDRIRNKFKYCLRIVSRAVKSQSGSELDASFTSKSHLRWFQLLWPLLIGKQKKSYVF